MKYDLELKLCIPALVRKISFWIHRGDLKFELFDQKISNGPDAPWETVFPSQGGSLYLKVTGCLECTPMVEGAKREKIPTNKERGDSRDRKAL